jgi:predicted nuclease of restriction endonuclease-like RecB superfamily
MAKKIKLPKTTSEVGLLIIHIIKEIFRQIEKYGPEVVKLISRVLSFLGKWGSAGIQSLKTYLDKEEKRLSASAKSKTVKAKRHEKTKTHVKRKAAKKRKSRRR